ncbi:MAG TPA: cell division protein FtsL [Clostridiaceae bacterium]|nr:cell division protein FtsL [Clostridiaceae bacterium]
MKHGSENYVYGTAVPKIEYDVYEDNKVLKEKKKQKAKYKVRLRIVFTIIFVFAASLLLMSRYALITELNYQVSDLDRKYNEIKNENSRLKVQIETEMSLSKVKEMAETRLGMQSPDRYQKVYIRVPKNDVTKVAKNYMEENDKSNKLFAFLMNIVNKMIGLID